MNEHLQVVSLSAEDDIIRELSVVGAGKFRCTIEDLETGKSVVIPAREVTYHQHRQNYIYDGTRKILVGPVLTTINLTT